VRVGVGDGVGDGVGVGVGVGVGDGVGVGVRVGVGVGVGNCVGVGVGLGVGVAWKPPFAKIENSIPALTELTLLSSGWAGPVKGPTVRATAVLGG
jgi:hypothetical protein